jgi:outer membrane lipoprotein-sorting protein
MMTLRRLASASALSLPLLLSGCFVLSTTRKLPIPVAPANVQSATAQEMVSRLNQNWEKLQTLNATVDIQASVTKSSQGLARDYTTFRGIILMRKPGMLRVYGRVPVIGITMFDMASDGKNFTLYIPSKSKAIKGANTLNKKSANELENLRPDFFYDAMAVQGLEADDDYMVDRDSETVEDVRKKRLLITPEYILSIMRPLPGSHELKPVRVLTIHRDTMLPSDQDFYDADGDLETQVSYSNYQKYDFGMYPGKIVIKRPLEDFQLVMTVEKVNENQTLSDDEFKTVTIPPGTQIQNLE